MTRDFQELAKHIDAYVFGSVFTLSVTQEGFVLSERHDIYAPDVTNDPDGDVEVDGAGWSPLTGMTGQYGYNGAVMHSSEFIGTGIAQELARLAEDEPQSFVVVTVRDNEPDDEDDYPAIGWAILQYTK